MSVTFQAGVLDPKSDYPKPIWTCKCNGYCDACYNHEPNLANSNARDVLSWLDLEDEYLCGRLKATEFRARCKRRLWDEPRNHDPGMTADEVAHHLGLEPSCRVITQARAPGYIRAQITRLLKIAEEAIEEAGEEETYISWG